MMQSLTQQQQKLQRLQQSLTHLNPHAVLERGYSLVQTMDGKVVTNSGQLQAGECLRLTFAKGEASASVVSTL